MKTGVSLRALVQTVSGSGILLVPLESTHAPAIQRLASDADIARTTLLPHPYPDNGAEVFIAESRKRLEEGLSVDFAVLNKQDRELMGVAGLKLNLLHENAEAGYWIGRPYWNRGYATEALTLLCAVGFESLELHRIAAHHMVDNAASGRVMQKVGMTCEGRIRQAIKRDNAYHDVIVYGILRKEFPSERHL